MRKGTLITGRDRSSERSIYVVEEYIRPTRVGQVALCMCWSIYYDGHYFYRNDPSNKKLFRCPLTEYRSLLAEDYPMDVHVNVAARLGHTSEHYADLLFENIWNNV